MLLLELMSETREAQIKSYAQKSWSHERQGEKDGKQQSDSTQNEWAD